MEECESVYLFAFVQKLYIDTEHSFFFLCTRERETITESTLSMSNCVLWFIRNRIDVNDVQEISFQREEIEQRDVFPKERPTNLLSLHM